MARPKGLNGETRELYLDRKALAAADDYVAARKRAGERGYSLSRHVSELLRRDAQRRRLLPKPLHNEPHEAADEAEHGRAGPSLVDAV